mmetsp:Transcript_10379/g.24926  ORF Transcript_10379/g.24926 Transcript_10379/m.24926 type:complete len:450 (+) Transcript_10379:166-1515(+)
MLLLRSSRRNPRENHQFQHNQQKTTRKRARAVAATARTVLTTVVVVGVSWWRFTYDGVSTPFLTQPSSSSSSAAATTSNGSGDDFCNLLKVGISDGPLDVTSSPKQRRKMIHGFVSNSGHMSFLYNVLISMQLCSNITWTPVVFAMDMDVCRNLRNTSNILLATEDDDSTSDNGNHRILSDEELRRKVAETVCIPYLDRHLSQLARDEPESVEQIENEIKKKITEATTTTNANSTTEGSTIRRYESTIGHNFFGWGSVEHKFLINVKLYAIRDILNCNHVVDAFISDTDIAFRDDPRPYFEVVDNNNNNNNSDNNGDGSDPQSVVASSSGDIIAQNDTTGQYKLSLNSGFMYWRNTPANRQLIDDMITTVPFWWVDQARVNWLLHNRSTPHTLLDAELFPNGNMMNHFWDKIEDKAVMIHANWNSKYSEKQQMLAKGRVWFLNDNITNL